MKKIVSTLFAIMMSLWQFQNIAASQTIDVTLNVEEPPDKGGEPQKGQRMPAVPDMCTIDFDNHRIYTSIPCEITAYELCDEDGMETIVTYISDYELVEYMSEVTGVFQLRLVVSERVYVGYIEL